MQSQVKVKMKTTIRQPNEEPEVYELWSTGSLIKKGDHAYLKYEEVQGQEDKNIKTTVKMGKNEALVLRSGGLNMRLPFRLNATQNGSYESEYGTLMVTTSTQHMAYEKNEHDGRFVVQYDLNVSGEPVGEYTLEFHYTEGSQ
ncbi:DUF1934 domain-containing protein [Paenisporosarcina indica]|uniref:DUF1934 domain-containing protein n=1 Tax=Paenisporosarcina indica TaxID=650093 RepID=UPI00094FF972|nr:DUF1934 domain-containing protein [Paenisporosarcina indica]